MPIISFHRASQTALGYRLVALAFTFASILLINPFARGGTVFELTQDGKYKVLYSFLGGRNADGAAPTKGVIRDSAGNLYGTTETGGSSLDFGTVFKLDSSGNETVLHSFTGYADGSRPFAGVVLDGAGNLYGTTQAGGAFADGTVFKVVHFHRQTYSWTLAATFTAQPIWAAIPSAASAMDAV